MDKDYLYNSYQKAKWLRERSTLTSVEILHCQDPENRKIREYYSLRDTEINDYHFFSFVY